MLASERLARAEVAPGAFFRDGPDDGAENRDATIEVSVNEENDEKISKGLLGTEAQYAVSLPKPLLPL